MKKLLVLVCVQLLWSCNAQDYTVTFKVDMDNEVKNAVGITGNVSPLSKTKAYPLTDSDADGVYEATLNFRTSKKYVRFRFVNGENEELPGSDDRILWFKPQPQTATYTFNEFKYYNAKQLESLRYSPAEVKEDVAVLGAALTTIHPDLYRYLDSNSLTKELENLEKQINKQPNITNLFKEVSKFLAAVKCSHTFTNPWNQGPDVKRAIFFQPDKIPFTFQRIDRRLFLDKNGSENPDLKEGWEITSINGVSTVEILQKLSQYTTSDGNNFEKKLERLVVLQEDKFPLFDIFHPLEFGTNKTYSLVLTNPETKDTVTTKVAAVSKTHRTKKIIEKYRETKVDFSENWQFKMIDKEIGYLSMKSFAVQNKEFDWKGFLKGVFQKVNTSKASSFIIDIRDNEGGQLEVVEYLLIRLLQEPFHAPEMRSSVRYLEIPDTLEKYISTWSKFPYSFKGKFKEQKDGRYYLKSKYGAKAKTYQPHKDGFKGKVYLITNAQNSSATHQMATYASMIKGIQLVGGETGGNSQGLNGGFMFFLRLPNSKVEIDIPVIHMEIPLENGIREGRGMIPDIPISRQPTDFLKNRDAVLEELLATIRR